MRIKPKTGEYYHVYNRGTDKRDVFLTSEDMDRFERCLKEFNTPDPVGSLHENKHRKKLGNPTANSKKKVVEIIAYSFLRNHYHLVLKQIVDDGVSKFMHKLGTGYTQYFNERYKRNGALFQGKYKLKYIGTNEYLINVVAYVNLNKNVHEFGNPTTKWGMFRSSLNEYLDVDRKEGCLCEKSVILEQFTSLDSYKKYSEEVVRLIAEKRRRDKALNEALIE